VFGGIICAWERLCLDEGRLRLVPSRARTVKHFTTSSKSKQVRKQAIGSWPAGPVAQCFRAVKTNTCLNISCCGRRLAFCDAPSASRATRRLLAPRAIGLAISLDEVCARVQSAGRCQGARGCERRVDVSSRGNRLDLLAGAPYGNRTRVSAVKGRRPGPLDEGRGPRAKALWEGRDI
jgi:hypothetical protein